MSLPISGFSTNILSEVSINPGIKIIQVFDNEYYNMIEIDLPLTNKSKRHAIKIIVFYFFAEEHNNYVEV